MIIEYKIDEQDFLTYQLWNASRSEAIQRKRQRTKYLFLAFYIGLGLYSLYDGKTVFGSILLIVASIWFYVYPIWERSNYSKHFKKIIDRKYKNKLGRVASLEIQDKYFIIIDDGSESRIATTEITEMYETGSTVYVSLQNGVTFIFPKLKIKNIDALIARLKELALNLGIIYRIDLEWEWK